MCGWWQLAMSSTSRSKSRASSWAASRDSALTATRARRQRPRRTVPKLPRPSSTVISRASGWISQSTDVGFKLWSMDDVDRELWSMGAADRGDGGGGASGSRERAGGGGVTRVVV